MFRLDDWLVEPRFVKRYSGLGFTAIAACYTRSEPVARQGWHSQNAFNAFVLKV